MTCLQVTEGLTFLHNDVKLVHSNMCPQSIIINKSGAWKIAGFDFVILNANTPEQAVSCYSEIHHLLGSILIFHLFHSCFSVKESYYTSNNPPPTSLNVFIMMMLHTSTCAPVSVKPFTLQVMESDSRTRN